MADEQDKSQKTEDATQRKLDEALRRGEIVYSTEVTTFLMLLCATVLVAAVAGPAARNIARASFAFLETPHAFFIDGEAMRATFASLGMSALSALGLALLALMAAGIAGRYLQDRPAFTGERLKPKLDRLNPISGFQRVFGAEALANFLKGLAKLLVVGFAVGWALWPRDSSLSEGARLDVAALLPMAQDRTVAAMIACVIAFAVIAAADYAWTRRQFFERQKMSRQDIKEEFRQSEGDPAIKARLRQIRMERARRRMMAAVPGATVVVTNPTHFAVALKYDRETTPAPICVAKGADQIAHRIRAVAEAAGVPVVEDPPLARALYAGAELDQPIPRETYEAAARVIGVVLGLGRGRRR